MWNGLEFSEIPSYKDFRFYLHTSFIFTRTLLGKRKREAMELTEEQWAKRLATPKKSKYHSVPPITPVPKKHKKGHLC